MRSGSSASAGGDRSTFRLTASLGTLQVRLNYEGAGCSTLSQVSTACAACIACTPNLALHRTACVLWQPARHGADLPRSAQTSRHRTSLLLPSGFCALPMSDTTPVLC